MQPADTKHGAVNESLRGRKIRSFVLRQGRITPAQQRAFDAHWQRLGLDYQGQTRDFDAEFGRSAPRVMEIGFGNGEQLLHASLHEPQHDLIGIEVHRPGVGRLMNSLVEAGTDNVRLYNHDAVEVLQHEIAADSLAQVRIYFPDPWHKKRHHKRRLIQTEFVALLASRVEVGGLLHLATDWAEYAEHMLDVLESAPGWQNQAGPRGLCARPHWRTETHFEQRGARLGHTMHDLLYTRI